MTGFSLEIVEGPDVGRKLPLKSELVLGRGPDADVALDDGWLSSRHARIALDSTDESGRHVVTIEDLGSSNGTFVNGVIVHGPSWLAPGDEVLVGVSVLRLRGRARKGKRDWATYREPEREGEFLGDDDERARPPGAVDLLHLLDASVKRRAYGAPPALLVLVVAVVALYMVMR